MESMPMLLCTILVLFSTGAHSQDVPTYFRDMCLAFKPLYWPPTHKQFAVITVNHAGGWNPHHPDQNYEPYPLQPGVQLTEPRNNYASYAYGQDDNPSHTEPQVLGSLPTLWNKFINTHGSVPGDVCLFTYNSPCSGYGTYDCANAIVAIKQQPPYNNAHWCVAYNQMFRPRSQTTAQAQEQLNHARAALNGAGIYLLQICNCKGHRNKRSTNSNSTENTCIPSLQHKMYQCLKNKTWKMAEACSSNPHASLALLINTAVWKCPPNNYTVGEQRCWNYVIDNHIGNACPGLKGPLKSAISSCVDSVGDYHIGSPLEPSSNGNITTSQQVKDLTVNYTENELAMLRSCVNDKTSGLMCSKDVDEKVSSADVISSKTYVSLMLTPVCLIMAVYW